MLEHRLVRIPIAAVNGCCLFSKCKFLLYIEFVTVMDKMFFSLYNEKYFCEIYFLCILLIITYDYSSSIDHSVQNSSNHL